MNIIPASYKIITPTEELAGMVERIAMAARTCYKSEKNASTETNAALLRSLIANGHEAMLEFADIHVLFICDRGVSHELVRHRMASYAQESTRYCNYSKDKFNKAITVIQPVGMDNAQQQIWRTDIRNSEKAYFDLLALGCTPEMARTVLPNSLKTEVNMKANVREWRHFLRLRTSDKAHPQMRELTIPLLAELKEVTPFFDDIEVRE